jgi:hypothetical protein
MLNVQCRRREMPFVSLPKSRIGQRGFIQAHRPIYARVTEDNSTLKTLCPDPAPFPTTDSLYRYGGADRSIGAVGGFCTAPKQGHRFLPLARVCGPSNRPHVIREHRQCRRLPRRRSSRSTARTLAACDRGLLRALPEFRFAARHWVQAPIERPRRAPAREMVGNCLADRLVSAARNPRRRLRRTAYKCIRAWWQTPSLRPSAPRSRTASPHYDGQQPKFAEQQLW